MLRKLFLPFMLLSFLQGCSFFGGPKLLWHAPIASTMKPIVQNGQVYVRGFHAGHPGESARLFALDAATGKENWVSADSVEEVYGESGGYVFFRNMTNQIVQLDARTGEQIYASEDSIPAILKWVIRGDLIFIVNASLEVVAINNRLSQVLWRKQLPAFCNYSLTTLDLADQKVVVSGLLHIGDEMYGKVWALDAATGQDLWSFEPPKPRSYAALDVMVHDSFVVATNTSPIHLQTYVLDVRTGKELYPSINAFDFYGFYGQVAYSPNGNFDLRTGQRKENKATWMANSIIHNGIAWQRYLGTAGVLKGFFLRTVYDGDVRGNRNWYDTPPKSSLKGYDVVTGEEKFQTKGNTYAQFSEPVEADGVLYHSGVALMKEGESGVWAYRLP